MAPIKRDGATIVAKMKTRYPTLGFTIGQIFYTIKSHTQKVSLGPQDTT